MLLKLLREGLGRVVIFVDWATRPAVIERSEGHQKAVVEQMKEMSLYQLYACPFCVKTRRELRRLNLPIETKNVQKGSPHRSELEHGGGRIQVPCLKINQSGEDAWIYESGDIIQFLNQKFG